MAQSLASFAPVFGRAKGRLSPSSPNYAVAVLFDFLFTLDVAHDGSALQAQATDFHSQSWTSELSARQLSDLRDDIGVGGTWEDFLLFLHQAFASEHVVVQLGGPASAVGGEGATSARLIGRKQATGLKVDLELTPVPSSQRDDTKGAIAVALHAAFQDLNSKLQQEQARALQLEQAYVLEKARAEQLQARVLGGRHSDRLRRSHAPTLDPGSSSLAPTQATLPATARTQDLFSQTQSQGSQPNSPPPVASASPPPPAGPAAKRAPGKAGGRPMPKRARRKPMGTKIGNAEDDEE